MFGSVRALSIFGNPKLLPEKSQDWPKVYQKSQVTEKKKGVMKYEMRFNF